MVTANPTPLNAGCPVGLTSPVTIPTTSPSRFTSGPPEDPGFTAAPNWMSPVSPRRDDHRPRLLRVGEDDRPARPALADMQCREDVAGLVDDHSGACFNKRPVRLRGLDLDHSRRDLRIDLAHRRRRRGRWAYVLG